MCYPAAQSEVTGWQQRRSSASESVAPAKGMRTFVTIWIGQVISIVGSSLTNFGLGVWIYQQTGEAMARPPSGETLTPTGSSSISMSRGVGR